MNAKHFVWITWAFGMHLTMVSCNFGPEKNPPIVERVAISNEHIMFQGPILLSKSGTDRISSDLMICVVDTNKFGNPNKPATVSISIGEMTYDEVAKELLYLNKDYDDHIALWGKRYVNFNEGSAMETVMNRNGFDASECVIFYFGTGAKAKEFFSDENGDQLDIFQKAFTEMGR